MKRMARIVMPVLVGIIIPLSAFVIDMQIEPLDPYRDGDGAILISSLFIRFALPIIFILCLFIQLMVVLPVWNKVSKNRKNRFIRIAGLILGICIIISFLLGYGTWQKQFGFRDLWISAAIVFAITLLYLVGNISTLYLFDRKQLVLSDPIA